jgi:hypothetical protein
MNEFDLIILKLEKRITRIETIIEFKFSNMSNYSGEYQILVNLLKEELEFLKEVLVDLQRNPVEIKNGNEVVL